MQKRIKDNHVALRKDNVNEPRYVQVGTASFQ